jgi:hypothetical protein
MQQYNITGFYTIILGIVLTISNYQVSAQKCKYEKNEIDAITEKAIKLTEPEVLLRLDNNPIQIKAQCIGEYKYLKLRYIKYSSFYIVDDREIAFKLKNDQEIVLFPRPMPQDTAKTDDITAITAMLVYKLSTEQYQLLSNFPIKEFKYYLSTGWMTEEINANKQNVIMNLLRCVE